MKMRGLSFLSVLALTAAGALLLAQSVDAKRPPPPPPPPPPAPSWNTYVKNYAYVHEGARYGVTPEEVQATSDGGSVALSLVDRASGGSWVVKLDPFGTPQWQREVGCFNLPPGSYALGVSFDQTSNGGYVLGGGTRGCGNATICPYLGGLQCGLVEKLDATGGLVWARVYSSPATSTTALNRIVQTNDGGYVAVGSVENSGQNTGVLSALVLKLDSQGNVQWRRTLAQPGGPTDALLNDVKQIADGGYIATGQFSATSACQYGHGCGDGVLVVKLGAGGGVVWQRGFNSFDANGDPSASEHALSIVQTSEGGFLVGGNWRNTTGPGTCCRGALLLKLDANGNSQWQRAYSGGVYCFFNGYSYQCYAIGADVYAVRQTSDGGFLLAGSGDLKLYDSVPLVPWLGKVDAAGNLIWQRFYYRAHPATGRPLSEYFPSSELANAGGYFGLGWTENPSSGLGELFGVKTDSAGLVGTCSEVRPATPLSAIDPMLATVRLGLPVQTSIGEQGDSPSTTRSTSITSTPGQC